MGWARAAPADSGDARWSGCCACCCSCCPSGSSAADEWYWWWCINGGGTDVERPLARQRRVLCSGFRVRCKTVCSLGIRADIYLLAASPLGGEELGKFTARGEREAWHGLFRTKVHGLVLACLSPSQLALCCAFLLVSLPY